MSPLQKTACWFVDKGIRVVLIPYIAIFVTITLLLVFSDGTK